MSQPLPTLLIFGAGGHGRVVADAALLQGGWQVVVTDRDSALWAQELMPGVGVLPPEDALKRCEAVHVAIGSASARAREVQGAAAPLATVIHPRAAVSPDARLEPGCFVAAQAVVAPGAQLGTSVIVNHGAVVDHDVQVGEYSHIAPAATLGGAARIGRRVLVGAGANVLPGVRVADDVTIGAGAVVNADIGAPGTYAGVPARRLP